MLERCIDEVEVSSHAILVFNEISSEEVKASERKSVPSLIHLSNIGTFWMQMAKNDINFHLLVFKSLPPLVSSHTTRFLGGTCVKCQDWSVKFQKVFKAV